MVDTVSDSFNRPDGPIGQTDGGNVGPLTWTSHLGSNWQVSGNKATTASPGFDVNCTVPFHADVDVSITLSTISVVTGVVLRQSNDSNYVMMVCNSGLGSPYALVKVVNGGNGTIGGSTFGPNAANGDIVRVVAIGSTYQCYVNGVLQATLTDTFNNTAINIGQTATGGSAFFDNFSAVDASVIIPLVVSGQALPGQKLQLSMQGNIRDA